MIKNMKYLSIFIVTSALILGATYFNKENLFKVTPEESKKSSTITIPLNNLNMPLVLEHVKDFSEIKIGMCIVKFKECNFLPSDSAAFKKAECAVHKFSHSYQVVEIDQASKSILGAMWYGTNYDLLVGQIGEVSLLHEKIYGFNDSKASDPQKFYQGNCGQIQAFNDQNKQQTIKQVAHSVIADVVKDTIPEYLVGQCVVAPSHSCPPQDNLEEWDKGCHPYSRSYRIEKVGKNNYQISTWYGYQNDFHDLLGFKETADFSYFKNRGFIGKDCNELKNQYPMGNYSAVFQFKNNKNKFSKSEKSN